MEVIIMAFQGRNSLDIRVVEIHFHHIRIILQDIHHPLRRRPVVLRTLPADASFLSIDPDRANIDLKSVAVGAVRREHRIVGQAHISNADAPEIDFTPIVIQIVDDSQSAGLGIRTLTICRSAISIEIGFLIVGHFPTGSMSSTVE
ncbi:hypothetical protein CDN99_24595 [Roseateles aquatilis]|uniref:Uncharacterized protein n=1 Tax=Roseateles aquatilis TaxID=431061 RepID=A0A246IV26_9BURK|nr:hypothetical protein CDN99_24595 [Roseateles aquatilis]